MDELMKINGMEISIKEYKGQRVVTFKEIDLVHGRIDGTARRSFHQNRKHFIEGTDFFILRRGDNALSEKRTVEIPPMGITLITETGYLMLVKSFTDELAWKVQRELVKDYFRIAAKNIRGNTKEELENIRLKARAICELTQVYERHGNEAYLYPLRSSIWMLAAEIVSTMHSMGKVV